MEYLRENNNTKVNKDTKVANINELHTFWIKIDNIYNDIFVN